MLSEPYDPQIAADALLILEWAAFARMASDNSSHHKFDTTQAAQQFTDQSSPTRKEQSRAEAALVMMLGFGLVQHVERRALISYWRMNKQIAGRMRAVHPKGYNRPLAKRAYEKQRDEADELYLATLSEDEQNRIRAVRADLLLHPESRAWEALTSARHYRGDSLSAPGPEGYFRNKLRNVRGRDSRLAVLGALIEETLAQYGVEPDDPFWTELVENLVKAAKSDAVLRLTDPAAK